MQPRGRFLPRHVAFVLSVLPATGAFRATTLGATRRAAPPSRSRPPRATAFSGDDAEPLPRQSSPLVEVDPAEEEYGTWVTPSALRRISEERRVPFARQAALHADVAYYGPTSDEAEAEGSTGKLVPTLYRINAQSDWQRDPSEGGDAATRAPVAAREAAARTLRWCADFVEALELCPWARLSRQGRHAIRMKVVHASRGTAAVERVAREGARELLELTSAGDVDANAGITFVVVLPEGDGTKHSFDFEFESFYAFCTELEEQLFDEADAAREHREDEADLALGDEITLAPFHPAWHFASPGEDAENALDYEKRAPYPTLSLVCTSAIEHAGAAATERIGQHNEEVLSAYGAQRLEQLYAERVLRAGTAAPSVH